MTIKVTIKTVSTVPMVYPVRTLPVVRRVIQSLPSMVTVGRYGQATE